MSEVTEWRYPGEHVVDGVTFTDGIQLETLTYIRDELAMFSDDIVVATYPKAGKSGNLWTSVKLLHFLKPFTCYIFQREHKHTFTFHVIPPH